MSGAHETQASIDLSATNAAAASKAVAVNLCFTVEGWTPAFSSRLLMKYCEGEFCA